MEILSQYFVEIFFGLVSAGLLAFCKHLYSQNKELKDYKEEDKNASLRQQLLDEIEPIQNELQRLKNEIDAVEAGAKKSLETFKVECEKEHDHMYDDLNKIQSGNDKNFSLIINSYKFRLIQLCKTHLRDGYITEPDYEQLSEMYNLYYSLGGNGQAKEYYEQVLKLEMRPE